MAEGWSAGSARVLLWIICLNIWATWDSRGTLAGIYRHSGSCSHKGKLFEAGQTFYRGCDKCYCYDGGYICLSPAKPTSWPSKCQRVAAACGYRLVYRDMPSLECHAYSWIQ